MENKIQEVLNLQITKENVGVRESVFGAIMRSEEWRDLYKGGYE